MTSYGGGKARLGKEIYKVIKEIEDEKEWESESYFEPFCGMLGVAKHFINERDINYNKIILSDANKDIILLWNKLKRGNWELPKTCTREKYESLKYSNRHTAERGFYGVSCAYSGIFFAGYRPKSHRNGQNFFKSSRKNIKEIGDLIHSKKRHLKIINSSYLKFKPKGMTIYCDPPYEDNRFNIEHFKDFDSNLFWDTMRKWSKDNLVVISEYKAPKDFKCIWKKDMKSVFSGKTSSRTEKLFVYKYGI
jgi:site-specific DNA-adenine methylase